MAAKVVGILWRLSSVLAWVPDTGSDVDAVGLNQLDQLGGFPENLSVDEDIVTMPMGKNSGHSGRSTLRCNWMRQPMTRLFTCTRS